MKRTLLVTVVAALALILAAIGFAGSAGAIRTVRIGTHVGLRPTNPFHGRVRSHRRGCIQQRVVRVYQKHPGPDGLYGSTTSDRRGHWSIPAGMPSGRFYARVKRSEEGAAGTLYICRHATSKVRTF